MENSLNLPASPSSGGSPARERVCVFGASWAAPDTPLFAEGVLLGAALATEGYDCITGGYGGIMEAVSKGCVEGGGGATGVLVSSLFPHRTAGNAYLTVKLDTPTLLSRIDVMLCSAPHLLVAMPGTLGTLTELFAAWNTALLATGEKATLVAWRQPWESIVKSVAKDLGLPPEQQALIVFVDGVEGCMAALKARTRR